MCLVEKRCYDVEGQTSVVTDVELLFPQHFLCLNGLLILPVQRDLGQPDALGRPRLRRAPAPRGRPGPAGWWRRSL